MNACVPHHVRLGFGLDLVRAAAPRKSLLEKGVRMSSGSTINTEEKTVYNIFQLHTY